MSKQIATIEKAVLAINEEEWAVLTDISVRESQQKTYAYLLTASISEQKELFSTQVGTVHKDILLMERNDVNDPRNEKSYLLIYALITVDSQDRLTIQARELHVIP